MFQEATLTARLKASCVTLKLTNLMISFLAVSSVLKGKTIYFFKSGEQPLYIQKNIEHEHCNKENKTISKNKCDYYTKQKKRCSMMKGLHECIIPTQGEVGEKLIKTVKIVAISSIRNKCQSLHLLLIGTKKICFNLKLSSNKIHI